MSSVLLPFDVEVPAYGEIGVGVTSAVAFELTTVTAPDALYPSMAFALTLTSVVLLAAASMFAQPAVVTEPAMVTVEVVSTSP